MIRADYQLYQTKGINDATVDKFHLGYRHRNGKVDFAYSEFFLSKLPQLENGVNRFKNYILIPVFDLWGEIKGVYGRNVNTAVDKKFKHDSLKYTKSNLLYGLNYAAKDIVKKGFAVVVEGALDKIVLDQQGIKNAVAVLGTEFTMDHLIMLSFFTDTIVLMFDGDMAGYQKMMKLYHKYSKYMEILFCLLPQGSDPDEFVMKYGKEELNKRIYSYNDIIDSQIKRGLSK